jgi:hypothetical protein
MNILVLSTLFLVMQPSIYAVRGNIHDNSSDEDSSGEEGQESSFLNKAISKNKETRTNKEQLEEIRRKYLNKQSNQEKKKKLEEQKEKFEKTKKAYMNFETSLVWDNLDQFKKSYNPSKHSKFLENSNNYNDSGDTIFSSITLMNMNGIVDKLIWLVENTKNKKAFIAKNQKFSDVVKNIIKIPIEKEKSRQLMEKALKRDEKELQTIREKLKNLFQLMVQKKMIEASDIPNDGSEESKYLRQLLEESSLVGLLDQMSFGAQQDSSQGGGMMSQR